VTDWRSEDADAFLERAKETFPGSREIPDDYGRLLWQCVRKGCVNPKASRRLICGACIAADAARDGAGQAIRRLLEDERPDLAFQISFPDDGAGGEVEPVGDDPDTVGGGAASLPDDDTGKRAA
jgi:hypothetical protein